VNTLTGVLDAEMVIGLVKGGVFACLSSLYAPLYIPAAVRQEVITGRGLAGEAELTQALGHWIREVPSPASPPPTVSTALSVADHEVLAIAQDPAWAVDHVLSGDRVLFRVASDLGLTCLRATDVVVLFKARGLVTAVKEVLDRMQQGGYGIAPLRYQAALQAAGEGAAP
jgi:predicted nucleic acid-binding protein